MASKPVQKPLLNNNMASKPVQKPLLNNNMASKPVQKPFKKLNKIKDTNNTSDGFFTNFFALIILFLTGSVVFVATLLPFFILASIVPVIGVPIIAILSGFALQRCLTVFIFFIITGKIKP